MTQMETNLKGKILIRTELPSPPIDFPPPAITLDPYSSGITAGHGNLFNPPGYIALLGGNSDEIIRLDAKSGVINAGGHGTWGNLFLSEPNSKVTMAVSSGGWIHAGGNGFSGFIRLSRKDGTDSIILDGESGDIQLIGADCAEIFEVADEKIDCGTVLVINNESKLEPCKEPYDKRVAGIVSGGGGYTPGIVLGCNQKANSKQPIALNGKAYCKVEAEYSSIEVGDLLTTSSIEGHAMKAEDPLKAFGAVIGKALAPLKNGTGFVPILVSLQ